MLRRKFRVLDKGAVMAFSNLTPEKRKVLQAFQNNEVFQVSDVRRQLGGTYSVRFVQRLVSNLVREGILVEERITFDWLAVQWGYSRNQLVRSDVWLRNSGVVCREPHKMLPDEELSILEIAIEKRGHVGAVRALSAGIGQVLGSEKQGQFEKWYRNSPTFRGSMHAKRRTEIADLIISGQDPRSRIKYEVALELWNNGCTTAGEILRQKIAEDLRERRDALMAYPINLYLAMEGMHPLNFRKGSLVKLEERLAGFAVQHAAGQDWDAFRSSSMNVVDSVLQCVHEMLRPPLDEGLKSAYYELSSAGIGAQFAGRARAIGLLVRMYEGKLSPYRKVGADLGISGARVGHLHKRGVDFLSSQPPVKAILEKDVFSDCMRLYAGSAAVEA
ncbi:hypothetical protein HYX10_00245 [Candidatus Woesearchaeota archaeon]|nr:hypothetical protein [Candidatus Woesearchaeota archaeon]